MAAADLRKDRRLIFIVTLVLPHQPRNAKRFYATHTEAACPPLDGLAVARGEAFYAVLPHQPRNAKRFYATDTEAACPPLDGLAVARGEAFYAETLGKTRTQPDVMKRVTGGRLHPAPLLSQEKLTAKAVASFQDIISLDVSRKRRERLSN